jgi:hypothetical protein
MTRRSASKVEPSGRSAIVSMRDSSPAQRALDAIAPLGDVAGREGLGVAAARRQLLAREAVQLQERRIDVDDVEVGVAQDEGVGRRLEDRPVLLLAQAQRLLGPLLLGDVAGEREDARHAADLDRLEPHLVPRDRAVGLAAAPLVGRTVAVAGELEVAARVGLGVGLVARAEDRQRRAEDVLAAKARDFARLRVEVDQRAGVPVVDDDAVADRLEDRPIAFLRLAHRLVGAQAARARPRCGRRRSASSTRCGRGDAAAFATRSRSGRGWRRRDR